MSTPEFFSLNESGCNGQQNILSHNPFRGRPDQVINVLTFLNLMSFDGVAECSRRRFKTSSAC
jgi:hypothetical protein